MENLFLLIVPSYVPSTPFRGRRRTKRPRKVFRHAGTMRFASDIHDMKELKLVRRHETITSNTMLRRKHSTTPDEVSTFRHVDGRPNKIVVEQRFRQSRKFKTQLCVKIT